MWPVLLLLLFNNSLSQPVIEDGPSRQTRELIECCPCPTARLVDPVDECPCRSRSADAEGAPSSLIPTTLRANRPFVKPLDSKEEQKNLLEPEVGLATSMLETLREATEQEYQDALARDAARAAAELDASPEESARHVVIVVNPRDSEDQLIPEASNIDESQCIHPLGTPLGRFRTVDKSKVPDVFRMPKLRGLNLMPGDSFDMDSSVGASNVAESKIQPDEVSSARVPFLRQKTPLLGFDRSDDSSDENTEQNKKPPLLPFKLSPLPKLNLPNPFLNTASNEDMSLAPSNVQEIDSPEDKLGLLRLAKRPTPLRNLLKLKDVELISKKDLHLAPSGVKEVVDDTDKIPGPLPLGKRPIPLRNLLQLKNIEPFHKDFSLAASDVEDVKSGAGNLPDLFRLAKRPTPLRDIFKLKNVETSFNKDLNVAPSEMHEVTENAHDLSNGLRLAKRPTQFKNLLNLKSAQPVSNNNRNLPSSEIQEISEGNIAQTGPLRLTELNLNRYQNVAPTEVQEVRNNFGDQHSDELTKSSFIERPHLQQNLGNQNEGSDIRSVSDNYRNMKPETISRTLPEVYKQEAEDDCIINDDGNRSSVDSFDPIIDANNYNSIAKSDAGDDITRRAENIDDAEHSASEIQPLILDDEETDELDSFEKSSDYNEDFDENSDNDCVMTEPKTSEIQESHEISTEDNFNLDEDQDLANPKEADENCPELESIDNNNPLAIRDQETDVNEDSETGSSNISPVAIEKLENFDSDENNWDEDDIPRESSNNNAPSGIPSSPGILNIQDKLPFPPLSDTLANLRENVRKTLEKLKITPTSIAKEIVEEDTNESKNYSDASPTTIDSIEPKNIDVSKGEVTLHDLQALSDNLLNRSTNKDGIENSGDDEGTLKSTDENESNIGDINYDIQEGGNIDSSPFQAPIQTDHRSIDVVTKTWSHGNQNIKQQKSTAFMESSQADIKGKEMEVSASEPVMNMMPNLLDPLGLKDKLKFPLINDPIIQPKIADPLNLLGKPIDQVLNLKPALPTLGSIEDHLSNVFDTNEKSALSDEFDYDDADEKMSPEASVKSFHKNVPSLKPLQDINVDIFKLNPIKSSQSDSLNLPRLNLNSYRTKLPIPTNLELKPIKLESSVKNKDGILGATLNFPNKSPVRKGSSRNSNILRNPFPSIDDIRDSLGLNRGNLLGSPLKPDLSFLKETNPLPITDLTEEIRRNAEKTRKGIEKKMRTTLRTQKIHDPLPLGKPQEFLEDFNDKLKAIQYDLNDRLSSFHKDLFETTKLKPLPSLKFNNGGSRSSAKVRPKFKPARLQSAASSTSPQNVEPRTEMFSDTKSHTLQRNNLNKLPKAPKIDTAASAPAPIRIEMPRYRPTPTFKSTPISPTNQNFRGVTREPIRTDKFPFLPVPKGSTIGTIKRPVFRNPGPFKENKVTISFGTTTPAPIVKDTVTPRKLNKPDVKESLKSKHLLDRMREMELPTEARQAKVRTPVTLSNNLRTVKNNGLPQLKSTSEPNTHFRLEKPRFRESDTTIPKLASRLEHLRAKSKEVSLRPNDLAKTGDVNSENTLTNKVRNAVRERLVGLDHLKANKDVKPIELKESNFDKNLNVDRSQSDMSRAASNNELTVAEEPLKENVSYKCKLVCTRE